MSAFIWEHFLIFYNSLNEIFSSRPFSLPHRNNLRWMIVTRTDTEHFAVPRATSHLTWNFLSRTTEGAAPVCRAVLLTLVQREEIAVDDEQFTAPTTSNESQLSVAWLMVSVSSMKVKTKYKICGLREIRWNLKDITSRKENKQFFIEIVLSWKFLSLLSNFLYNHFNFYRSFLIVLLGSFTKRLERQQVFHSRFFDPLIFTGMIVRHWNIKSSFVTRCRWMTIDGAYRYCWQRITYRRSSLIDHDTDPCGC